MAMIAGMIPWLWNREGSPAAGALSLTAVIVGLLFATKKRRDSLLVLSASGVFPWFRNYGVKIAITRSRGFPKRFRQRAAGESEKILCREAAYEAK